MERHICILLNGEITPTPDLKASVKGSFVIAADGGIRHAEALDLDADLWVGDFDSARSADGEKFQHIERLSYPADKAKSDGELALEIARSKNPVRIIICGATQGARTDHILFNLSGILRFARQNEDISVTVKSGRETILPLLPNQSQRLDVPDGTIFSIVPFSNLKGLTLTGVKWPLEAVNVDMGSTLTLSNVTKSEPILHMGDGHAIAIVQDQP